MTAVIAVDIGGTNLKGAVVTSNGDIVTRDVRPTFGQSGDVYAELTQLVADLQLQAVNGGHNADAIGIASPGTVDSAAGTVGFAANLSWRNIPLRARLEQALGLPVVVDNDARAGALAERLVALPVSDRNHFLFIPIGTGVSCAVIVNGRLVHGATGAAGEFGHMRVVPEGASCACGQRGCIEAYASARSIEVRYLAAGGGVGKSARDIASRLDEPRAAIVWMEAINALATGIASLTAALDPSRVVIGGGLSAAGSALIDPLRVAVERLLPWRPAPPISASTLGTHAGLIGAALLSGSMVGADEQFVTKAWQGLQSGEGSISNSPTPSVRTR